MRSSLVLGGSSSRSMARFFASWSDRAPASKLEAIPEEPKEPKLVTPVPGPVSQRLALEHGSVQVDPFPFLIIIIVTLC